MINDDAQMSHAIVGQDVTVTYRNTVALDSCDFSFLPGTVSTLVGPNGSGKSTLLSAIAGLVTPSAGEISVLGTRPGARNLATRLAYVLQATPANSYLPITVREVVMMARFAGRGAFRRLTKQDRQIVNDAMERLEVNDLAERHLRELSGGQRQRVLVAQGLAQQAQVMLLDEPLTGLDLSSAQRIADVIVQFRDDGGIVLLATHDLADAERSDQVLLMAGRIVVQGPPKAVITMENLRDAYGGRLMPTEAHPHVYHHEATTGWQR